MPVRSNRAVIDQRIRVAASKALVGAAQLYRNAMQESLRNPPDGGYTSGAWDHGMAGVAGSVAVGEPEDSGDTISVGVGTNVVYAKFWEFGHQNLFTRQFERVERWRPTLDATADAITARFKKLFGALMRAP